MTFQDLWILIAVPIVVIVGILAKRHTPSPGIRFSTVASLKRRMPSVRLFMAEHIYLVRMGALLLCIIALARPQLPLDESKVETEGIDIVLAVDVSSSMLAEDFTIGGKRVNRLEAVKDVMKDFIDGRSNDRISIVAFAARAYMVCPLTLDYGWLLHNLERLKIGLIEDGTAIGSGVSSALNRLKDTKAKGKVIILLTDGRNNAGDITPETAAEAAQALDVKVYTIGAGTKGMAPYPVKDFFGNVGYQPVKIDIDEESLMQIATVTRAQYFRATDTASLKSIYKEIDELETVPLEERGYLAYQELFPYFLIPGIILLLLEILLSNTVLRKIP